MYELYKLYGMTFKRSREGARIEGERVSLDLMPLLQQNIPEPFSASAKTPACNGRGASSAKAQCHAERERDCEGHTAESREDWVTRTMKMKGELTASLSVL
jgi:N-acyl-D-aspartate/D-glutamate deacylase